MNKRQSTADRPSFPRGAVKAFREWMNARYADTDRWHHGRYGQRVNKYGDYLYRQDREKFNVELADALAGHEGYPGFVWPKEGT